MKPCPCKGCPERAIGCHSEKVCKRGYPEWVKEQAAEKKALRDRIEMDYVNSSRPFYTKGKSFPIQKGYKAWKD